MRFVKSVLGMVAVAGVMALSFAFARAPAKVAPKEKIERGWFDSFKDGTLGIKSQRSSASIKIPDNAKTFVWNHHEGRYQAVETAASHEATRDADGAR